MEEKLGTLEECLVDTSSLVDVDMDATEEGHEAGGHKAGVDIPDIPSTGAFSPAHFDSDVESGFDSLFDSEDVADGVALSNDPAGKSSPLRPVARRSAPPIPGLFFDPTVQIPEDLAEQLWNSCMQMFFHDRDVNQIMLFERAGATTRSIADLGTASGEVCESDKTPAAASAPKSGLPGFLTDLLTVLETLLSRVLPPEIQTLLFPPPNTSSQARQVILNHYMPGEGIISHVDLLKRYGDGIIGVSLHSGCAMKLERVDVDLPSGPRGPILDRDPLEQITNEIDGRVQNSSLDEPGGAGQSATSETGLAQISAIKGIEHIYLPPQSIIVLSGEARYNWAHGIERLKEDLIENEDGSSVDLIARSERLSITYRWLLPGADVVGEASED